MSGFCRDLFPKEEVSGDSEEIELTLGLSMNGRFGVDPKQLARSSSIPDFLNPSMEPPASLLMRSCSLPVKTEEEELRKRKEIQSLRRLEAKMKRTAKQRHSKGSGGGQELQNHFKIPKWVPRQPPQGSSVGSQQQGSDSSSESDSLKLQGVMRKSEGTRSSPSITDECEGKPAAAKLGKSSSSSIKEIEMMLENMPCVSTKGGDGPNGKRIEGFLYRYSKKEEVRIVCVCHGSFLSPLEFVQHAGGGDVAHPLRHIVVNHSPFL